MNNKKMLYFRSTFFKSILIKNPKNDLIFSCKCWLSFFGRNEEFTSVFDGLKTIYKEKLLPLEKTHLFHEFHSPMMTDQDFDAKPLILLIGQYSTGKTTLIRYLLQKDFPGLRIGPEPTTDRFIVLSYGDKQGLIPGNALASDPNRQFKPLTKFGTPFLNRLQMSFTNSPVLKTISIVDTPGILAGEKQSVDRGYDFAGVLQWFAERVDQIILLFDANKLDISDEFRRSIEALQGHDDKIRIVLNKSDMVDETSLLRVYGALMWSLGKVLNTPEVPRVYVGSFWDKPLLNDANRRLFEEEEQSFLEDIQALPKNSALRKLNDLTKRARLAMVHAYLTDYMFTCMPAFFGRGRMKQELIDGLDDIYKLLEKKYAISRGDFPEITTFKAQLKETDFARFEKINPKMMNAVNKLMGEDIARVMSLIPSQEKVEDHEPNISGGVFEMADEQETPFGRNMGEGIDVGRCEEEWVVNTKRDKYDAIFRDLGPVSGKVPRSAAKEELMKSKLPYSALSKIWKLADVDKDGLLDEDEFALAYYLVEIKLEGHNIPSSLPEHLIPPSKREPMLPDPEPHQTE